MTPTKLLLGQILIVFAIVLAGLWTSTQWIAAQLAYQPQLGVPWAIAFGHPWGASGALLVVRLFSRMVRQDAPRFGVAACAVGGGQGVALLVERVG